MFPIILSLLLRSETKGAKIAFPLKLLAILFLVAVLFTIQVSQKIFKIGKDNSSDKTAPLISVSVPKAEAYDCWCSCDCGCDPCSGCFCACASCTGGTWCDFCGSCNCGSGCACEPANSPPSVDNINVQ